MALEAIRKLFPGIGIEGSDPDPVKPIEPDPNNPNQGDPATGTPPGTKQQEPAPTKSPVSEDPLAAFASIFDNKPPGDPKPEDIPLSVAGVLTPETISKLTENLDFNSFMSQATRDALAKGEDSNAVFAAFNEIAKGSYQTAMQHSATLSEKIIEDRIKRLEQGLGDKINAHQLQTRLSADDVISKSPVLKAGISMIADNIRRSQPDADPNWIAEQATKFFVESAKLIQGDQASNPGSGAPGQDNQASGNETDWMGFAMGDTVNNPSGVDPTGGDQGAQ
jgi:hypothetical protein